MHVPGPPIGPPAEVVPGEGTHMSRLPDQRLLTAPCRRLQVTTEGQMSSDGTNIPEEVKPYLALTEGVDIDGTPQVAAVVGDDIADTAQGGGQQDA